ncbi:MAG: phenylacetate--CoA ligase family protein [Rhodobacteraceae bacterium]|nr:phenylacetate--CoA ligase family protein [Paracoccaceae bacterium]
MIDLLRAMIRDNPVTGSRIDRLMEIGASSQPVIREIEGHYLRRTLQAAVANLPAYRSARFLKAATSASLSEFPLISKQDLLESPTRYYPRLGLKKLVTSIGKTSGTTGTPLTVYRSLNSVIWEYAFVHRHWSWSGFRRGMPRATLRGDIVATADSVEGPFWRYNTWENQLVLSSRHLRAPYIQQIVEQLDRFGPYLLQAYPSTAYELARYLQSIGRVVPIPFVYTGSEILYSHQRDLIEHAFDCKVMDFYGMAERVAFAAQCESGSYHVNTEYSKVEIVDDSGNQTDSEGFIVGTTFHNLTMPLVRYRLSDRSRWKKGDCPCGRIQQMIEPITGKFEDVIQGSEGNVISPSVVTFAFKGLQLIERSQVAQVGPGKWEIRVVPLPGFGVLERSALIGNIHKLIDPGLEISIVECTDIPRTNAYKYRWIVDESKTS